MKARHIQERGRVFEPLSAHQPDVSRVSGASGSLLLRAGESLAELQAGNCDVPETMMWALPRRATV
jgi:hypothetical protein